MEEIEELLDQMKQLEAGMPYLPKRTAGEYEVVSCIQKQEEKQVLKLRNKKGEYFILKSAKGSAKELLKNEAGMMEQLDFQFLPDFFWYEEEEDTGYLLREYIRGITLWDLVQDYGVLGQDKAVELMIAASDMVGELHHHNPPVICRDIKPQNLVLRPDGRLFLIDMGTARYYRPDADLDTVLAGTRATAAPEQFGFSQSDEKADIYGIGKVFCYLLTGGFSLGDEDKGRFSRAILSVILKCTRFSPDERYADVSELKKTLKSCRKSAVRRKRICAAHIGAFLLAAVVAAAVGGRNLWMQPDGNVPVEFTSPLLEEAVRQELGKTGEEAIYQEDLKDITQLLICGNRVFENFDDHRQYYREHWIDGEEQAAPGTIRDIALISGMENLRILVLDNQNIQDISALKGLPLEKLSLCKNPIRDISVLKDCPGLRNLSLEETMVEDLAPLSSCHILESMDIGSTYVDRIEPLGQLELHTLQMVDTPVKDYSPLQGIPLTSIVLSGISPEDYAMIGSMSQIEELTIYGSGITSLSDISGLVNLQNLDLAANRVQTIEGIEAYPELRRLCVEDNPVNDISPLKSCPKLENLEIEYTNVEDFSVLNELPALYHLVTNEKNREKLLQTVSTPWFSIEYRPDS